MKGRLFKIFTLIFASALAAGAFTLCAFAARLPNGTFVNGVNVGGLTRTQAVEKVRQDITHSLKGKILKVHAGGDVYTFSYPEIFFKDNVVKTVNSAVKRGSYTANVSYFLNGFNGVVSGICAAQSQVKREPCAIFNPSFGAPFEYEKGVNGVCCDRARLAADIDYSLKNGFCDVYLHTRVLAPAITLDEVKDCTTLLSSFTTYYDGSNSARSHNIALAAKHASGSVIAPRASFSFNQSVGPRTEKRGYKRAKVIEGGRYVYGIGGGVCQVSTTLYNAALLAGLNVTEYHAHSLPVSYVSPSRDAMVSGTYCDLKFTNTTACPVYIRVLAGYGYVKCEIYGKSNGSVYSVSSEYLENSEDGGIRSRAFITRECGGVSDTRLLRTDCYLSDANSTTY